MNGVSLADYQSPVPDPDDFDDFWSETLQQARRHPLNVRVNPTTHHLATIDVFDVRFCGANGNPVSAWLRVPRAPAGSLPVIVEFDGYGKGRGKAEESLLWSSSGFAHLEMDTRGQSWSGWTSDTSDPVGDEPHMPGMLTKGVSSKETYYYRRVFTDAVRAFDALQHLPRVDASRAFALGTSQGGGIALAASALAGNVQGTAVRVPFLCDIPQSIANTTSYPYGELADYLSIYRDREAEVLRTMSYFDGVNFARRVQSPALFSVALRDTVCPPASIYGAYNAYAGEKALNVWRFNGHEGGGIHDDLAALGAFDKWSRRLQQNAPVNASARDSDRHGAAAVPDRALNRENTAPNRAEPMPSLPRSRRKQEEEEPL